MTKITNTNFYTLMEYLENGKQYQIDNTQSYTKRIDNILYFYSYDTCILQVDFNTKTIYNNTIKYSTTTSRQKNNILKQNNLNYFDIVNITPIHKNGWYLEKLI